MHTTGGDRAREPRLAHARKPDRGLRPESRERGSCPANAFTLVCLIGTGTIPSLPLFSMASPSMGALSSAALVASPTASGTTAVIPAGDLSTLPGFGSVPPKLTKKILTKEYIDIWELLPETWQLETEGSCCHSKRPRRSLVYNRHQRMDGVFCHHGCHSHVPSKAPHFFAYLRTITKASRTFESTAWASTTWRIVARLRIGGPWTGVW